MSTLSVDTIQGKTTAGTVAMPSGHVVQVITATSGDGSAITATTTTIDVQRPNNMKKMDLEQLENLTTANNRPRRANTKSRGGPGGPRTQY